MSSILNISVSILMLMQGGSDKYAIPADEIISGNDPVVCAAYNEVMGLLRKDLEPRASKMNLTRSQQWTKYEIKQRGGDGKSATKDILAQVALFVGKLEKARAGEEKQFDEFAAFGPKCFKLEIANRRELAAAAGE